MATCRVDDVPRILAAAAKTWGDLLEILDRELAARRRGVTAVRFDGVDQPSFRAPAERARPLRSLRTIDIATEDAGTLLAGTLAVGRDSVAVIAAHADEVAAAFRRQELVDANLKLSMLLDALRMLTTLTATIATATGIDLAAVGDGEQTAAESLDAVRRSLETLVGIQEQQRWADTAACLSGTLRPAIVRWAAVFDVIEARCLR